MTTDLRIALGVAAQGAVAGVALGFSLFWIVPITGIYWLAIAGFGVGPLCFFILPRRYRRILFTVLCCCILGGMGALVASLVVPTTVESDIIGPIGSALGLAAGILRSRLAAPA